MTATAAASFTDPVNEKIEKNVTTPRMRAFMTRETTSSMTHCRFRRKPATYSDLIAATLPI
jgi:hypothetical protein